MKRILLLLGISLSFHFMTGQGWNESKKFGVKLGLGFSSQSNDRENTENWAVFTPSFGFFAHIPIPSISEGNLGVTIEGIFTVKGGKFSYNDWDGSRTDSRITLGYLQVPVLLQYTIGESFKIFGNLGLAPGIAPLRTSKLTYTYLDSWGQVQKVVSKSSNFSFFDFDFLLGGGARFNLGSKEVAVEGRMDFGLIPVGDFVVHGTSRIVQQRNFTMLLMFCYPLN